MVGQELLLEHFFTDFNLRPILSQGTDKIIVFLTQWIQ